LVYAVEFRQIGRFVPEQAGMQVGVCAAVLCQDLPVCQSLTWREAIETRRSRTPPRKKV
jgi:hypothetical protein